jgi:hypothetical protein
MGDAGGRTESESAMANGVIAVFVFKIGLVLAAGWDKNAN